MVTVTTDSTGAVSYTIDPSSTAPGCSVDVNGNVTATGAGTCVVDVGVASDNNYLASSTSTSVTFTAVSRVGKPDLVQSSGTSGSVTTTMSSTFSAGPITVEGNSGPVTFVTTVTSSSLAVSSTRLITTTGSLTTGSYNVSGTDSDPRGDTGTWTYTLTVTAPIVDVTFDANGGSGSMAPEDANAPTGLSLNQFVRKGYTFVDWNTSADGSGISYGNGASYPFTVATTLYAHWKRGKVPTRTITFNANGGKGTTASEIENTPTAIKANEFTRGGFRFVDWTTKADGTGARYEPGNTYAFKTSITLYAQWKKVVKAPTKPKSFEVTFRANGGAGTMPTETHHSPNSLASNHFSRSGYTFVGWNTAANGKGVSFAEGATYPFASSTILYAQWKKVKVTPVTPPIPGGMIIGKFATGSSTLTANLKSEIENLATEAKAKRSTQITLYGFGDSAASSGTSAGLSRARAASVATYLEARLAAVGLKGWAISITTAAPSPSETSSVVATLS